MEPDTFVLLALASILPFALLVALAFRAGEKSERGFWTYAAEYGQLRRTPDGRTYDVSRVVDDEDESEGWE